MKVKFNTSIDQLTWTFYNREYITFKHLIINTIDKDLIKIC